MKRPHDRRELFKALGASAVFLHPLLSARYAYGANEAKKRFLCFVTSSGVIQSVFWPTGDSSNYDFKGTALEALTPFKGDLSIIKGLRNDYGPFDSHSGGAVSLLTGDYINNVGCTNSSCDYINGDTFAKSASIDQIIADSIQGKTSLNSLVMAIMPTAERPSKYVSFSGNGKLMPQATNPYSVFNSIFRELTASCNADTPSDPAALAKLKAKRKSILDVLKGDLNSAVRRQGLDAEEKSKLEAYTDGVRQIERSIDAISDNVAVSCGSLGGIIGKPEIAVNKEFYAPIARLMMDLIVAAFQLDVTRVATIIWSVGGVDGVPSTWAQFNNSPINESYHSLTHQQADPQNWQEKCKILDRYHAGEFAYLLDKLKSSKENDTNLLDSSLAMWTSEIGEGSSHTDQNIPFVIAGKAAGSFKSGQYLSFKSPDTPHQRLLLSILNAMDVKGRDSVGRSGKIEPLV